MYIFVCLVPAKKLSIFRYPDWLDYKLSANFGPKDFVFFINESVKVSAVIYKNLTVFLPQRSVLRMK